MSGPRICDDETAARDFFEALRWPEGPVCPDCASSRATRLSPRLLYCSACRRQYSVTVGTIFSSSHIPLHKWLRALYIVCEEETEGASVVALQHELQLASYTSAWAMARRLRWALTRAPLNRMLPRRGLLNSRRPLKINLPFRETVQALLTVQPSARTVPRGERAPGAKPASKRRG